METPAFAFGGRGVRIRVVGRELARRIGRPFSHLRVDAARGPAAELEVDLWDGAETGVPCEGGDVWADTYRPAVINNSADGRWISRRKAASWLAFDRTGGRLVGWVADGRRLTQYETGRPLHAQLLLWYRDRGIQAVHAGLVSKDGAGVLIGGPGGAGKSTVAVTCLRAGFDYLSDDYVGIEAEADGWVGHSLYASAHLEPKHLERFPELAACAIPGKPPREDKSLVFLSDVPGGRLAARTLIRALVLPRIVDADATVFRPAGKAETLVRLAPSSLLMTPYTTLAESLRELARFAGAVPTFWLDLGRDLTQIPLRMTEILARFSVGAEAG